MGSVGFSAFKSALTVSTETQIADWSVTDPYYGDVSFDASAGEFTVPETGTYAIKATLNYSTTAALLLSLGSDINPSFTVSVTSPTPQVLVSALFPILNVSVALLTLRAILGNGTVTLAADVELTAGDVVGLFYNADGLTLNLALGGPDGGGLIWSMFRIA